MNKSNLSPLLCTARRIFGGFLGLMAPTIAVAVGVANAEPVCVTTTLANLRSGPGPQNPVTWTVSQNMPLNRLSQKGKWSQVQDVDGVKHWVISSSISNGVSCAVVKTKSAKLREGPGTNHPVSELASADRYTPFRKIQRDGAWLLVQDDYRGRYWINESNVWIPQTRSQLTF